MLQEVENENFKQTKCETPDLIFKDIKTNFMLQFPEKKRV